MSSPNTTIFAMVFTAVILTMLVSVSTISNDFKVEAQSPNVNASNVYDNKTMILGNNIKNNVILIPNEAHEPSYRSPDVPEELRVINQPCVPQNVVVNTGTTVVWFNADVPHDHSITLVNGLNSNTDTPDVVFESGNT
ncbi:MAG TPA: hypothetical protein VE130_01515 [Nitrososphaeraceae archaeon]|nr:hypothetical protein [Nitrososphaeraceae archaeon]